ncbi:MAG: pyridoxal-5-phosphate-dependent protein subunit beta, partial [Elusimicrobia bacterium CG11_big_fil_rev_8_21_14_0_20_64_6]
AVNDEDCMRLLRLFNDPAGKKHLLAEGVDKAAVESLSLIGISGVSNMLSAVKMAKYYELGKDDIIFTIFTDSVEMYRSRLGELETEHGKYDEKQAAMDMDRRLRGAATDNMRELNYRDRKALHNLKYFTWVEQQGRTSDELRRLWDPEFWTETFASAKEWDKLIGEFNKRTGLN